MRTAALYFCLRSMLKVRCAPLTVVMHAMGDDSSQNNLSAEAPGEEGSLRFKYAEVPNRM